MLDLEQAYANLRQRSLAIGIVLPPYRRRPEDVHRAVQRADYVVQERTVQQLADRFAQQLTELAKPAKPAQRKRRKTKVDYYAQHDSHVRKHKDIERSLRAWERLQQAKAHAYDHHIEDLADDFYASEIEGDYFPHLDPALPYGDCFHYGSWRRALFARYENHGY